MKDGTDLASNFVDTTTDTTDLENHEGFWNAVVAIIALQFLVFKWNENFL